MLDLQQFLRTYEKEHIHIRKPVKLDHVGALVGQADDTIVFDHIQEHPGWHLVDQLFVNRKGPRPGCWAVIPMKSSNLLPRCYAGVRSLLRKSMEVPVRKRSILRMK